MVTKHVCVPYTYVAGTDLNYFAYVCTRMFACVFKVNIWTHRQSLQRKILINITL